jgi:hypothetical protein
MTDKGEKDRRIFDCHEVPENLVPAWEAKDWEAYLEKTKECPVRPCDGKDCRFERALREPQSSDLRQVIDGYAYVWRPWHRLAAGNEEGDGMEAA